MFTNNVLIILNKHCINVSPPVPGCFYTTVEGKTLVVLSLFLVPISMNRIFICTAYCISKQMRHCVTSSKSCWSTHCTSFGYHFHIICISNKWDIQQILLEHPLYINWSSVGSPHKRPVTDLWNSLCAWTSCFRNHVVTDDLRQNNGQLQFLKYYRFRNYVILVYGKSMNGR